MAGRVIDIQVITWVKCTITDEEFSQLGLELNGDDWPDEMLLNIAGRAGVKLGENAYDYECPLVRGVDNG